MQIVIELSEENVEKIKNVNSDFMFLDLYEIMKRSIKNGIILPKGHGRIIDADAFKKYIQDSFDETWSLFIERGVFAELAEEVTRQFCNDIDGEQTVIPADKKEDIGNNTYEEELIQQGRKEVWEWCGKYIPSKEDGGKIPVKDLKEIFGITYFREIFDKYSYSDAVSIVKEYEREKEHEEICVGDEVYILDANHPKVVTYTDGKSAVFISQRGCYGVDFIRNLKKTGRNFPEIAEVLKKMVEQNG